MSSFITLYISNEFGTASYGEYSLYAALLSASLVFGGFGINAFLQNTLPRAQRTFFTVLVSTSLIRFFVALFFSFFFSYFYNINVFLLSLYFTISSLSLMIYDNVLIYEGRIKLAFYSKFVSNIFKLFAIVFISDGVESYILQAALFDFFIMITSIVIQRSNVRVRFDRVLSINTIARNFMNFKSVYFGNLLSFFQTPAFLIMYFSSLSVGYEELSSFSFVVNIGFFFFNAISLLSRTESIFVSKSLLRKAYFVNFDIVKLSFIILVSANLIIYFYKNEIIKFIFNGNYGDTYYFINIVGVIALINSFNYLLSPIIYLNKRFSMFSISSLVTMLGLLILPVGYYIYDDVVFSFGIYALIIMSVLKVVYMYSSCYKISKDITLNCMKNVVYIPLVAMVAIFISQVFICFVNVNNIYLLFFSSGSIFLVTLLICSYIFKIKLDNLRNV